MNGGQRLYWSSTHSFAISDLGQSFNESSSSRWSGWMDEIRFTDGFARYDGLMSGEWSNFSQINAGWPTSTVGVSKITIPNSTTTVATPFELTYSAQSTDAQVDGAGLVFPGDTEKSLKWNDTNDNFQLTGGDLKVTGNEVNVNGTKIIDDTNNTIDTEITFNQITGAFSGGEYS